MVFPEPAIASIIKLSFVYSSVSMATCCSGDGGGRDFGRTVALLSTLLPLGEAVANDLALTLDHLLLLVLGSAFVRTTFHDVIHKVGRGASCPRQNLVVGGNRISKMFMASPGSLR